MKVYKLTDECGQTQGHTQWGPGVENWAHPACVVSFRRLCTDFFIHWYQDPVLALFMDPVHGEYLNRGIVHLWEAETLGKCLIESLKGGSEGLRTIREIPLPDMPDLRRVAYTIFCVRQILGMRTNKTEDMQKWKEWSDGWLADPALGRATVDAMNPGVFPSSGGYPAGAFFWEIRNISRFSGSGLLRRLCPMTVFDGLRQMDFEGTSASLDFEKLAVQSECYTVAKGGGAHAQ